MKKLSAFFIAIMLLLSLAGCSQKEFADKKVSFKGASTLDFYVGEQKTVTTELPDNNVDTTLTVKSSDPALKVSLSDDGVLTMTGDKAGSYSLSLTLSAKGYADSTIDYPVEIKPQKPKVKIKANGSAIDDEIELVFTEELELAVKTDAENAKTTVTVSDENVLFPSESSPLTLKTASAGECDITLSVTAKDCEPYSKVIHVKVTPFQLEYSLSAEQVSGNVGSFLTVAADFPEQAILSASCDNSAVSVKTEGRQVIVTSNTAGSYDIAVICSAENYYSAEKHFTAVFTARAVDFSVAQSISIESGKSVTLSLADFPAGTSFSLQSTPKVSAYLNKNSIIVIANAAGKAEIGVTASCAGYQSSTKIISVTITSPQVNVTSKYDDVIRDVIKYTNQERQKHGVGTLEYLPDIAACCQIRAKEASQKWAHERLDERSFETVFYDMGFLDYYAAGENLLMCGRLDGKFAVEAWMDSPGHRENLLRDSYDSICVGIYYDSSTGYYYYAQHFIDRYE